MKAKPAVLVLILLCAILGATLWSNHKKAVQLQEKAQSIESLSQDLVSTSAKLSEQVKTNILIQTNLVTRTEEAKSLSNELTSVSSKLVRIEAEAKAAAQAAKEEVDRRDVKITELETEKDELTKRMTDLTSSIASLEDQIKSTENKLTASEGDRTFLLKELKRLQTEKAELEKQLTSLAFLREQVHKLKDEVSISRRLDWIRRGLYGNSDLKGAEKLQQGFNVPVRATNYNLNVELNQDGSVKVNPPATNAPAGK